VPFPLLGRWFGVRLRVGELTGAVVASRGELPLENLSFGARFWLAIVLPFKVLFDGRFAAAIARAQGTLALPGVAPQPSRASEPPASETALRDDANPAEAEPDAVVAIEPEVDPTAALQLLAILQREGRFIDFVQEDMSGFGDAEIGAAARVVQEGCKRGLAEYLDITSVRTEAEGAAVTLDPGYDAHATRITGNLGGQPPYVGVLAHHGWRVTRIALPRLSDGHDPHIVAPAEVEVGA